jgi:hypothetical protein
VAEGRDDDSAILAAGMQTIDARIDHGLQKARVALDELSR